MHGPFLNPVLQRPYAIQLMRKKDPAWILRALLEIGVSVSVSERLGVSKATFTHSFDLYAASTPV